MTADGTVIATVAAGGATDAAGNANTASTTTDNTVTYDTTAPDGDDQPGGRPGRPDQHLADQLHGGLQRAVTGFTDADVTLSGTAGGTDDRDRHRAAAPPTTSPSAA